MYCSSCGEENMDNLESCIYCGSKLKTEKELQKIILKKKINFLKIKKGNDLIDKYIEFARRPKQYKREYSNSYVFRKNENETESELTDEKLKIKYISLIIIFGLGNLLFFGIGIHAILEVCL